MSNQSHNSSLLDLEPDTLIELYELDLGEQDGLYRFHPGKNNVKDIMLRDKNGVLQTYYALPIEASGFESRGDGQLPRPRLLIANPQGVITDAIKRRSDLVGNTIIRKRIFLKFLDNENFPNNFNPFAIPDPESRFDDDIFSINRKLQENKYYIEFELVSPLELEDVKIPARVMIADYCGWQYRGAGCLYGKRDDFDNQSISMADGTQISPSTFFTNDNGLNLGIPVADENNKKFNTSDGYNLTLNWVGDYDKDSVSVVADGAASSGATSLAVDALSAAIAKDRTIVFSSGATFKLSADAASGATSLSGVLSGDVADDETGDTKYVAGDTIKLTSRIRNLSKENLSDTQEDAQSAPDLFFVCIKEVATSKDPRYEQEYWRTDECGKNLTACKCRYFDNGQYKPGLPFGGFPSIEKYKF